MSGAVYNHRPRRTRPNRCAIACVVFGVATLGAGAVPAGSADDGVEHPCATRPGEIALCR